MSKRSKRDARVSRDIHAAIRTAADQLRSAPYPGMLDAVAFPELNALLDAASRAVEAAVPKAFPFHGRMYFLRARIAVQLDVFESAGAAQPLVCGAVLSTENAGHAPGH